MTSISLGASLSLTFPVSRTAFLALSVIWTISFGYAQQYEPCEGDLSCGSTDCRTAILEQSTLTDHVLCINKDNSHPLYYNIQGCAGTYTQPGSQNTFAKGICLSEDMDMLRLTVANIAASKHKFTCYQNDQFTSYIVIVFSTLYKDITILVNGVERSDTNDIIEGDEVIIIARAVGDFGGNIVKTPICIDDSTVTCTSSNIFCSIGQYFQYFFSSVSLAHNGNVVSFTTNNGTILGSVTLSVHERPTSLPPPSTTMEPSTIPTPAPISHVTSTAVPTSSPLVSSPLKTLSVTSPYVTTTSNPKGGSSTDHSRAAIIVITTVTLLVVVVIALILGVVCTWYWCNRGSVNSDEEKGTIKGWPSIREHTVMIYPCATCAIDQLANKLKTREKIRLQSLPSDLSEDIIIKCLGRKVALIGCTCNNQNDSGLQRILHKSKQSVSKDWNIVRLNKNDGQPVDDAISYTDINDDSLLDAIVYRVSGGISGRSSITPSLVNVQILNNTEELLDKIDQVITQRDVDIRDRIN